MSNLVEILTKKQFGKVTQVTTEHYEVPDFLPCLKCGTNMPYYPCSGRYECQNIRCGNWISAEDFIKEEVKKASLTQENN